MTDAIQMAMSSSINFAAISNPGALDSYDIRYRGSCSDNWKTSPSTSSAVIKSGRLLWKCSNNGKISWIFEIFVCQWSKMYGFKVSPPFSYQWPCIYWKVTTVKLHSFNDFQFCLHSTGLFSRDNSIFANFFWPEMYSRLSEREDTAATWAIAPLLGSVALFFKSFYCCCNSPVSIPTDANWLAPAVKRSFTVDGRVKPLQLFVPSPAIVVLEATSDII